MGKWSARVNGECSVTLLSACRLESRASWEELELKATWWRDLELGHDRDMQGLDWSYMRSTWSSKCGPDDLHEGAGAPAARYSEQDSLEL
jgi:hypothetical protein